MSPVGFDLDMTLIDSRPAIMAAFAELARETATVIDLAAVDGRLGIKLEDEVAFWFPPGPKPIYKCKPFRPDCSCTGAPFPKSRLC